MICPASDDDEARLSWSSFASRHLSAAQSTRTTKSEIRPPRYDPATPNVSRVPSLVRDIAPPLSGCLLRGYSVRHDTPRPIFEWCRSESAISHRHRVMIVRPNPIRLHETLHPPPRWLFQVLYCIVLYCIVPVLCCLLTLKLRRPCYM